MIEQRISQILSANTALTSLVDKIRPLKLRDGDGIPSITYFLEKQHDVTFQNNSGLVTATLETNVFAKTFSECADIQQNLKQAVILIPGVITGLTVFNLFLTRELQTYDPEQENYQINTQFTLHYSED